MIWDYINIHIAYFFTIRPTCVLLIFIKYANEYLYRHMEKQGSRMSPTTVYSSDSMDLFHYGVNGGKSRH